MPAASRRDLITAAVAAAAVFAQQISTAQIMFFQAKQYLLCVLRICAHAAAAAKQWCLTHIPSVSIVPAYSVKQLDAAYLSLVVGCAVAITVNAWTTGPVLVLLPVLAVVTADAIFFATQVNVHDIHASYKCVLDALCLVILDIACVFVRVIYESRTLQRGHELPLA